MRHHRWKANLRILDVQEIKTVPYALLPNPFVKRLIGTISRELLDHSLFWNAAVLERKLPEFQSYFNEYRVHSALGGHTPAEVSGERVNRQAVLHRFGWQTHCRGLYQLPLAA